MRRDSSCQFPRQRTAVAYLRDYFLGSPLLSQLVEEVLTLLRSAGPSVAVRCSERFGL
jgi:hypothetical protein